MRYCLACLTEESGFRLCIWCVAGQIPPSPEAADTEHEDSGCCPNEEESEQQSPVSQPSVVSIANFPMANFPESDSEHEDSGYSPKEEDESGQPSPASPVSQVSQAKVPEADPEHEDSGYCPNEEESEQQSPVSQPSVVSIANFPETYSVHEDSRYCPREEESGQQSPVSPASQVSQVLDEYELPTEVHASARSRSYER
jgi:hypothetical protein